MGTQKPRILPWLISQLNQGQLEGVAWLDEGHTRFRIPWKHGLRQDAQQEDFGIFQAWAEASGAYTPGKDKPDLPTWKRNFRSALNRKEALRLAEDHSKDPHDPHKIYEFVTSGVGDFPEPDTSLDLSGRYSTSDTHEDSLDKLLSGMDLASDAGPQSLTLALEQPPQLSLSPSVDAPASCPNLGVRENPLKQLLANDDEWEFQVTVFYRGCQVFQQTVCSPGGLRLVGSEAEDGTLAGQPVRLPDPAASLTDRGVADYVRRVLSCLGGGLALWRAGQWLWAQRLGHCHVYWAMGEELIPDSGHKPDGEVPKDREGGVFDLGPFIEDLIAFIEGSRRSPRYTLWFCMGQSWPQDEPWVKRLVMVKVRQPLAPGVEGRSQGVGGCSQELQRPGPHRETAAARSLCCSLPSGASACPCHGLTPSLFGALPATQKVADPKSWQAQLPGVLTTSRLGHAWGTPLQPQPRGPHWPPRLLTWGQPFHSEQPWASWFILGDSGGGWCRRFPNSSSHTPQVVPMCLRALVDMARDGGASSLENTVDLHISNSHPLSLTSDQYKACLRDLVEDMDF
uniref:Interferon regulatory factor 3 n=1 Tax=Sus scrofa TaxID=9823 RepID=A0A8D1DL76_PIG